MDISIILVNYNTKDLTKNCLKSVFEHTLGLRFEVFVVDNNSQDGSCEMIEQEFPQVRLIKNRENKGFGAANNIAMKLSKAKYVFLLNTDTILVNNAVKILFDFMEDEEHKKVGACGGTLYYSDMTPQHSYGRFPTIARLAFISIGLNLLFKDFYKKVLWVDDNKELKNPKQVEYVTGADILFRKSAIDKVGYFDEEFFMYSEDVEIAHRLLKKGFSSYIVPEAKIIHLCNASTEKVPLNRLKMLRSSQILYFQKIYGRNIKYLIKLLFIIRYTVDFRFNKEYFEKLAAIYSL